MPAHRRRTASIASVAAAALLGGVAALSGTAPTSTTPTPATQDGAQLRAPAAPTQARQQTTPAARRVAAVPLPFLGATTRRGAALRAHEPIWLGAPRPRRPVRVWYD